MQFIGREEQLSKIEKAISEDQMHVSLIYGRRRVGKSELVKQALQRTEVKSIYYECKQVTEASNTQSISDIVSAEFGLPRLAYTKIEELLDFLFKTAINEKLTLVLDEYPYLRENVKGLDSILQSLIDKYRDSSKLKLIILGSYVEIMRSLIGHANPLFGRVDLVIDLKQMDYYESSLFYPKYSPENKVRVYSVFGGVPYYNRLIDDSKSVRDNIIDLVASTGARLENEISMYLNSEISKTVNANEVFEALAAGYSKYSDILSQSHVSSGPTLVDVLDKLIRMEVVSKTTPVNDESNRKKAGYHISDNLSLFYYRYVFRYLSQMTIMDSLTFYDKYINKDFEEYFVPHQFEDICRQYLIRQNKKHAIEPPFEKIGKYYYDDPVSKTNGEFDIVTEDEIGYVFYEVKFRNKPITESMIDEEITQIKQTGLTCSRYVFISRSGFTCKETENTMHIELKEMY